ncbi:MAG: TIGR03663 family protein [Verrucomicrobiales bacterium]|nr:TIGR03663 family protein [Verrucomicrobiales bacterium]
MAAPPTSSPNAEGLRPEHVRQAVLVLGMALALMLAFGLRAPRLAERPMHTDESVHAIKFIGLLESGRYVYDPHEYHGPSLYYATLPAAWLTGAKRGADLTETTLRSLPLVFGVGLLLLLPLTARGLGRGATLAAAWLLAVSPMMVFYSRYFIHELLLVFFTYAAIACGWRYLRGRRVGWLLAGGAALGLMQATKETFVFCVAAAGFGLAGTWVLNRWWPVRGASEREGEGSGTATAFLASGRRFRAWHLVLAGLVTAGVSVVLFSSFFTHPQGWWQGPLDSIRTYAPWLSRAGGESPHIQPWPFYLERLLWWQIEDGPRFTEAAVIGLALVGIVAAGTGRGLGRTDPGLARFLALYTLALTAVYTVIAYKTPWCALGFYHGFILLAGVGTGVLWRWWRPAGARALLLLAAAGAGLHLSVQACHAAFTLASDPRNPWVYAHTAKDLLRLVERVQGVAAHHPDPARMVVKVMAPGGDYWPLPWYFRNLANVGYWPAVPEDPFADVVVVNSRIAPPLDDLSEKEWIMAGFYQQRPPKVFLTLYAKFAEWKTYIESLPPPSDDEDEDEE